MLSIIKKLLLQIVNDIDSGNSNITQEEQLQLIDTIQSISSQRLSKYQACRLLNIKRAKFDNLVRENKLPKGKKQAGFKELQWSKQDLMKYITNNK